MKKLKTLGLITTLAVAAFGLAACNKDSSTTAPAPASNNTSAVVADDSTYVQPFDATESWFRFYVTKGYDFNEKLPLYGVFQPLLNRISNSTDALNNVTDPVQKEQVYQELLVDWNGFFNQEVAEYRAILDKEAYANHGIAIGKNPSLTTLVDQLATACVSSNNFAPDVDRILASLQYPKDTDKNLIKEDQEARRNQMIDWSAKMANACTLTIDVNNYIKSPAFKPELLNSTPAAK